MWRFGGHPRARRPSAGSTSGSVTRSPAIIGPPLASLQLRVLIRNVGNTQGVVLKLVSIQLLDGSERDAAHEHRVMYSAQGASLYISFKAFECFYAAFLFIFFFCSVINIVMITVTAVILTAAAMVITERTQVNLVHTSNGSEIFILNILFTYLYRTTFENKLQSHFSYS